MGNRNPVKLVSPVAKRNNAVVTGNLCEANIPPATISPLPIATRVIMTCTSVKTPTDIPRIMEGPRCFAALASAAGSQNDSIADWRASGHRPAAVQDSNPANRRLGSLSTGTRPAASPAMSGVPPKAEVKSGYWHRQSPLCTINMHQPVSSRLCSGRINSRLSWKIYPYSRHSSAAPACPLSAKGGSRPAPCNHFGRAAAHSSRESRAGHIAFPQCVRLYSTFGGTCG
jgi:hypothetical protein